MLLLLLCFYCASLEAIAAAADGLCECVFLYSRMNFFVRLVEVFVFLRGEGSRWPSSLLLLCDRIAGDSIVRDVRMCGESWLLRVFYEIFYFVAIRRFGGQGYGSFFSRNATITCCSF